MEARAPASRVYAGGYVTVDTLVYVSGSRLGFTPG